MSSETVIITCLMCTKRRPVNQAPLMCCGYEMIKVYSEERKGERRNNPDRRGR